MARFLTPVKNLARYFLTDELKKGRDMNNTLKFVAGFLAGGALGLAAGLLVAPSTGRTTRKKISKKSKKLAKKMAGYVGMEEKFQGTSAKRKDGKASVEV